MASAAENSIGDNLRQERLRKQLDLATVSKRTRLCTAILEAIEENRFESIPGGAYRRHFIRQYANALGMDGDAIVAEFQKQYQEPPLPLPVPPKKRRSSLWADAAAAIVLVSCFTATYHIIQKRSAVGHADRAVVQQQPIQPQPNARPAAPQPAEAAPAPNEPPASPPQPSQPGTAVHVAFTATEPVWVSVKCDGNATYAGVLQAPQSRIFDAAGTVTAWVGNAGGLIISVNGKPVGPLGAHGEVETLELTPNGARRIARPAPAKQTEPPDL